MLVGRTLSVEHVQRLRKPGDRIIGGVGGDGRLAGSAGVVDGLGHIGLSGGGQPVAGQSCQSLGVFGP